MEGSNQGPDSPDALRYRADVDLSNPNLSRTQLILLTGSDKTVLEVGPAAGDVTKVLSQRGCQVTAIEIDPLAAHVAARYAKRMIVGNVEVLDLDETLGDQRFDVILLGDVLEHMVHPQKVLSRLVRFLEPDGYIVASIPNVTHASIRLALLAGRFRYTDVGLLDRTHLRFFDREGVEELFRRAGCHIVEWRRTEAGAFDTDVEILPQEFPEWLVEAISASPEATTFQFVVKATHATEVAVPEAAQGPRQRTSPTEHLSKVLAAREEELALLRAHHEQVVGSLAYRLLEKAESFARRLAPWGTRRRSVLQTLRRGYRLLRRGGWGAFFRRLAEPRQWLPRLREPAMPDATMSPSERYELWVRARLLSAGSIRAKRRALSRLSYRPTISLVMLLDREEGVPDTLASVRDQIYPAWELLVVDERSAQEEGTLGTGDVARVDRRIRVVHGTANDAVELATGAFVAFLRSGDELKPNALYEVVKLLNQQLDLNFIYTDHDALGPDGRLGDPFFKPDWSPDLMMSMDYATSLGVFRRDLIRKVGGLRPERRGAQVYDLALRVTEETDRIRHCPFPAYTRRRSEPVAAAEDEPDQWRESLQEALVRRGHRGTVEDGLVPGRYRVRYELPGTPAVDIVIPIRDRLDLLEPCLDSIRKITTYPNYAIVVVANESREAETLTYLESFPGRVIHYPHPFNFARMVNSAVAEIRDSALLLLLNSRTRVVTPGWIEAMLEHGQRREVGAVGARLLNPDGHPQHEGIAVGVGETPATNLDCSRWYVMGDTIRNCSAVTAACMLIRRDVYEELGGFDERLSVAYHDVDLCLRARQRGYSIVYTPYAVLYQDEGSGRGKAGSQRPEDDEYFRRRWRDFREPYYNPNFDPVRLFELNWSPERRIG